MLGAWKIWEDTEVAVLMLLLLSSVVLLLSAPVGAGEELVSIARLVGMSVALEGAVAVLSTTLDASDGEDVGVGEAVVEGSCEVVGASARISEAPLHRLCGPLSLRNAARMFWLSLSLFSRMPSPPHASLTDFVIDARPRTHDALHSWPVKSLPEQSGMDCS